MLLIMQAWRNISLADMWHYLHDCVYIIASISYLTCAYVLLLSFYNTDAFLLMKYNDNGMILKIIALEIWHARAHS